MSEEEVHTIYNLGLASKNKKEIINFLEKLNLIAYPEFEKWEGEIFNFFTKINIVPYVIESTLNKKTIMKEKIKNSFFKTIINGGAVFIDSNDLFKELNKIYESLKNGTNLKNYLEYLFQLNFHIKKSRIKSTDSKDTRFKEFGVAIQPMVTEILNKKGKIIGYENIYFILPDKNIDYPLKEWKKEISENWRLKLKNKFKGKKMRKRDPIESRLRHEVFKRDEYKCQECSKSKKETILHCDHILPVSQGGMDEMDNLQTLCQACNLAKSNKMWRTKKN